MRAIDEIIAEVEEVYGVSNPFVYNGTNYDGNVQATGWWYREFGHTPFFLGTSKAAALETLDQVQQERADTRP